MNRFNPKLLILLAACFLLSAPTQFAQCGPTSAAVSVEPVAKADSRSAQSLYEEANGYQHTRFQEFNKQNLPFDRTLEARTKQEQKDLAAKNAMALAARSRVAGEDLYYLGMLYHLDLNSDKAYDTMQRFLSNGATGEKAQLARAVVVVHVAQETFIARARAATETYAKNEPQSMEGGFIGMETLLTTRFINETTSSMAQHS